MVYSNLNSTVFYNESGNIDPEDVGHEAVLYEMEIFGKRLLVVFGKLKHTFIQRNVVYLPVYLVVHHKVKIKLVMQNLVEFQVKLRKKTVNLHFQYFQVKSFL